MKIKEMIVVEGKNDTIAIQRAVNADTIETNGIAIGEQVMKQIELALKKRGVIIFTDPDVAGEKIRQTISERFPDCKHAFLPKMAAKAKNDADLGIEHAAPEHIQRALQMARMENEEEAHEEITFQDLLQAGLIAGENAKKRREKLSERLNIGYVNGKQLHKRLLKFRITKEEFLIAYRSILKEEEDE